MGKYVSVLVGLAAMAFGIWGILATWPLLWTAVKATAPVTFVLGGLLAVLIGFGEIRDSFTEKKPPAQPASSPSAQKS